MVKKPAKSRRTETAETALAKKIAKVVGKETAPRTKAEREVAEAIRDIILNEMQAAVSRGVIVTRIGADAVRKFRAGFGADIDAVGYEASKYWNVERSKIRRMLELAGGLADIRAQFVGQREIDWPILLRSLRSVKSNTYAGPGIMGRWCRFMGPA